VEALKHGYLAGMLVDLLNRSGRADIKGTELWPGPTGGEHERGLMVQFRDGASLGLKVVSSSPVGGHPAGADDYTPADRPACDLSAVVAGGTGAAAFCAYLAGLLAACQHPDIARVEVNPAGRPSVLVVDGGGFHLHVLPARATAAGGRRLPDWDVPRWGATP
jgi:hypothetical protein